MKMETPLQRAWRVRIKPHSVWAKLNLVAKRIWQDRVSYLMAAPYVLAFVTFILLPVLGAIGLSFTFYNMIETPHYVGLMNY
ncbi:MAG: hypothetical protein WBK13_03060, partial [Limnochordia bacterium]